MIKKLVQFLSAGLLTLAVAFPALSVETDTTVIYYHHDVRGDPVVVTTEEGDVLWVEAYRAYGSAEDRVSSAGIGFGDNASENHVSRLGYTGHQSDSGSGLTYMQQRHYDPVIGRFMSNDPVGYVSANQTQSFNRYLYANNNPYAYYDPNGEFLDTFLDIVTTAVEGGELLGTAAAYAAGKITGNTELAEMARADIVSEAVDVAISVSGLVTPGVPSVVLVAGRRADDLVPNSRGYDRPEIETKSGKAVKQKDATDQWDEFLGPNQTNIDPRDGLPYADRIWSADGKRSIRFGEHEMNSKPNKLHYHQETWHSDKVENVLQRIPK